MAASLSDAQLKVVSQQISAHPEILQAFRTYSDWASKRGRMAYVTKGGPPNPQQVLKQYGINFPDIGDYQIQMDPSGQVQFKRENWFQRNADWILPVATIGTGGVANAFAGGGAVAGGGDAASQAGADMVPGAEFGGTLPTEAGLDAGTVTGGGIEGGSAAGGPPPVTPPTSSFGNALKQALPAIIGGASGVVGAKVAASGNDKAAQIAADQSQKALDQAKLIYQQQRADLSPYRQEGEAALGAINFGMGLPSITPTQGPFDTSTGPQGTTVGAPTTTGPIVAAGAKDAQGNPLPGAGQNQVIPNPPTPAQTMGTLSTVGGGGTVRIQDPTTGLVHLVPQGQAAAAQQAGGRLV